MIHRHVKNKFRAYAAGVRHFVLHHLLHTDDPPHRLGLGVAIAMFVTFTPTVGVQMALTVFLAWILRANKAVGLPIVWISNPATLIPIYYSCYALGCRLLGYEMVKAAFWKELAHPPAQWWPAVKFYWTQFMEIATPVWLGGIVIGLATAVPAYYAVYYLVRAYRLSRWGQLTPPPRIEDEEQDSRLLVASVGSNSEARCDQTKSA